MYTSESKLNFCLLNLLMTANSYVQNIFSVGKMAALLSTTVAYIIFIYNCTWTNTTLGRCVLNQPEEFALTVSTKRLLEP